MQLVLTSLFCILIGFEHKAPRTDPGRKVLIV